MDPRCRRKSVQTHKIVRGRWATVSVPLFIATANGSSLLLLSRVQHRPFSNERRPYLLVDVKSSDAALHSMTSLNESNNKSNKFCISAAAVYYYGIWNHSKYLRIFHPQIFSTPLYPATANLKTQKKNTNIANPRNINPTKIKAHTVLLTWI